MEHPESQLAMVRRLPKNTLLQKAKTGPTSGLGARTRRDISPHLGRSLLPTTMPTEASDILKTQPAEPTLRLSQKMHSLP